MKAVSETVIVLLLTVLGSRFLLNVNTMLLLTATPAAPFAGHNVNTTGADVSATPDVPVVKLLVNGATVLPA